MKRFVALAGLALGLALATQASATATAITVGSGWQYDEVDAANAPSVGSPWTFTLTGPGVFSLTDNWNAGDIYQVIDDSSKVLLGTSTFYAGSASDVQASGPDVYGFNEAWTDASYSHLSLLLGAGTYSLDIEGNCAGGCPAGLGVRLDTLAGGVPEPSTWAMLILGVAMAGFALRRRNEDVSVAA